MEDLMKSMQTMFKSFQKEEDDEKYFCPRYNSKVKILNW